MVQQVSSLRKQLLDTALPLPLRFRVLFSLRAVNTDEAVDALLAGECPCARGRVLSRRTEERLANSACTWPSPGLGDPSALFRHEVAFALGQMRVRGQLRPERSCCAAVADGALLAQRRLHVPSTR